MNLLHDDLLFIQPDAPLSLPGLFAALAADRVRAFPALRPHQRPAWHMFLVQLATLALRGHDGPLPQDADQWRAALLALTGGNAAPWALTGPDDRPAFLQPAVPPGLTWSNVPTPDALDMLITSRNHDHKQQVAQKAAPQDWVFALISLQTMEGYNGRGNQGIARMNGAYSSRPLLGLAPATPGGPDPSAWWRRDVAVLRQTDLNAQGKVGGPALIWTLPWPEGRQLALTDLDPLMIEVCRRIRLVPGPDGTLRARRSISEQARIDAKQSKGSTGDPWAPLHAAEGKSLTLGDRDFDYHLISELVWGDGKGTKVWHLPPLTQHAPDDGDMLLVAEAIARGNSRTDGFKSRVLPIPGAWGFAPTAGDLSRQQITEINAFDLALRNALAVHAAAGLPDRVGKEHYQQTIPARRALDARADAIFFDHLWRRLAAAGTPQSGSEQAIFLQTLHAMATDELARGLASIPVSGAWRARAEVVAEVTFERSLRRNGAVGEILFPRKTDIVEADHD